MEPFLGVTVSTPNYVTKSVSLECSGSQHWGWSAPSRAKVRESKSAYSHVEPMKCMCQLPPLGNAVFLQGKGCHSNQNPCETTDVKGMVTIATWAKYRRLGDVTALNELPNQAAATLKLYKYWYFLLPSQALTPSSPWQHFCYYPPHLKELHTTHSNM